MAWNFGKLKKKNTGSLKRRAKQKHSAWLSKQPEGVRKAVSTHKKFLQDRRVGLTRKQTRKSSDITSGRRIGGGTVPSRRSEALNKILRGG